VSDDQLLIKGREIFGRNCHGAGDAIRIGEGTSAVLRGKQVAFDILQELDEKYDYDRYLAISKEYIDSQQHPVKVLEKPFLPTPERMHARPFVLIDCLYGFACNPCQFACPHGAITKTSSSTVPLIDFDKCTGCMQCVYQCPGLAIFGYNLKKNWLFLPVEYEVEEGAAVFLVNNEGEKLGTGTVDKVLRKPNKTHVARVKSHDLSGGALLKARGFILQEQYPEPLSLHEGNPSGKSPQYICHCDDVTLDEIMETIGNRKFISVDEIKHTTRLGMGACRGKRCIKRLKQTLDGKKIALVGEATPRGPLSNQVNIGELYPRDKHEQIIPVVAGKSILKKEVKTLVAGGGIGGSALFRYLAEAGMEPVLINYGRGASWRNIAGGRPNFSVPELADIARHNLDIFKELQNIGNIDFRSTRYVTFAHDEATRDILLKSLEWSDGYFVEPADYHKKISPFLNNKMDIYLGALITHDCWQATPGRVIDLIRTLGIEIGGKVLEDCQLIDAVKENGKFRILVRDHDRQYIEYTAENFINAMGPEGGEVARKMGIETGLFPVKHQAFITRRLPYLGLDNNPLDMLIDRRNYKGFVAVYGQQLGETGQIIGCASPAVEPNETGKNLKINSKEFIEIISEVFVNWLPELSSVGFQAVWAGYYVEPRMIIDPQEGLFLGLRGQGFMLAQYLAKLYVDHLTGKKVPDYFHRLSLHGDGLLEKAFK